jgi:hypothetical protein
MLGVIAAFAATTVRAQEAGKAAEVNGTPIMAAELDAKLGNDLAQLQQQIFTLRQKQLNTMIDQKLLEDAAAMRGVTISALVESEVTSHVTTATSEEVEKFFKEEQRQAQRRFQEPGRADQERPAGKYTGLPHHTVERAWSVRRL